MNLLDRINTLWSDELEAKTCGWAQAIAAKKELIEAKATRFHEWAPLYVYTSVSRVKGGGLTFSLRYEGQEVAELDVKDGEVWLKVGQQTRNNNARYFGVDIEGRWPWRGQEAAAFRRAFRKLPPEREVRGTEKRIEAEFLRQMAGDGSKFDGTLKHIRPVLIGGCPFQFPLPISGNTGEPEVNRNGKGSIDILARRGTGAASKLSVWELKAPGAEKTSRPIEQAYIYAVQLLKMLRSSSGRTWFQDVLGYGRELPERLVVESVVAVCPATEVDRAAFQQRLIAFRESTPLIVETGDFRDEIRPLAAYYRERPLRIELLD